MGFERDPSHWLYRHSPREWLRAALAELSRAEEAYKSHNARAGHAGCLRAAGMALNGALIHEPNEAWGRTYVDHVEALARDGAVPEAVREAAARLASSKAPGGPVISLRSKASDERLLEAARDVMAHAYARVVVHEPEGGEGEPEALS